MATTKQSIIDSDRLGLTNIRLLNKEDRIDYSRVEGPSLKITSKFLSPEGKRLFLRLFGMAQLQFNFIGGVARAVMDVEVIAPLVDAIKVRIDELHATLNTAIDGAELLFKQHGIANVASYDTPPLEVEVPILCALGRQYYEALVKFDQLMPLLQTLQIHEVVSDAVAAESCARLKGDFRKTAGVSRRMADRLRTRLFTEAADRRVSVAGAVPAQAASDQGPIAAQRLAGSSGSPAKSSSTPMRSSNSGKPATATPSTKKNESGEGDEVHLSANARKRLRKRLMRQAEEKARMVAEQLAASQPAGEGAGDIQVIPLVGGDTQNSRQASSEALASPAIPGTAQGNGAIPHPSPTGTLAANGKGRQAGGSQPSEVIGPMGKPASHEASDGPQPDERYRGQHRPKEIIDVDGGARADSEHSLNTANGAAVDMGSASQPEHVVDHVDRPTVDGAASIAAPSGD